MACEHVYYHPDFWYVALQKGNRQPRIWPYKLILYACDATYQDEGFCSYVGKSACCLLRLRTYLNFFDLVLMIHSFID